MHDESCSTFSCILISISGEQTTMTDRAKIFQNGGSQAVRLPKTCRFPNGQREVIARRVGKKVILEPADEWSPEFLEVLGSMSEEIEQPPQRKITEMKDPFD